MPDTFVSTHPRQAWAHRMTRIGSDHGFFHRLGRRHAALFVQEGETLLLSFDRADVLWLEGENGLPLGFDLVTAREWSLLSVMSVGRSWFRDAEVVAFLEGLANEGFFSGFRQILIVASGPQCTHAAARAAAIIPGARVLLNRPVAAVNATNAPFETRFSEDRRGADPDTPTPLGPEALTSADQTMVFFDPTEPCEAAQAALFRAPGTERMGFPAAGDALDNAITSSHVLVPMMTQLSKGGLTRARARALLRRAIRKDPNYVDRLRQLRGWSA